MKIGILTSGGDTPGMNAVIRAILLSSKANGDKLIGYRFGWKGLLENDFTEIDELLIDNIDLGGTILKSGRTNPLKLKDGIDRIRETLEKESVDVVIAIGGEDTLGVANKLSQEGLPMIGVPKTIDNDLDGTDYTFGFNTAVTIATEAIDRLKTTAKSHDRVIVVEIMGRHAGWMTLHAGIAGGAHVILIPEFELDSNTICNILEARFANGQRWAIVAVSEGFGFESTENQKLDEFGHPLLEKMNIAKQLATEISTRIDVESRAIVLGHVQRGGSPTAYDRVLCSRLGLKAYELARSSQFGKMPALIGTKIQAISLNDAVSKLKTVDQESWDDALKLMGLSTK